MTLPKIGQTTLDTALLGKRDAHHIACVLVTSDERLSAGDPVRFTDGTCRTVVTTLDDPQAIVDPFLSESRTSLDELFWVILLPSMVTNLHHQFDIEEPERVIAKTEEDEDFCNTECHGPDVYTRVRFDDDGCSGSWCEDH